MLFAERHAALCYAFRHYARVFFFAMLPFAAYFRCFMPPCFIFSRLFRALFRFSSFDVSMPISLITTYDYFFFEADADCRCFSPDFRHSATLYFSPC